MSLTLNAFLSNKQNEEKLEKERKTQIKNRESGNNRRHK